jgi:hypothetical protein
MSEDREYKCLICGLIIKVSGSRPGTPDKKEGGPCPKNTKGEHSWTNK